MDTARDLAGADPWRESLERSRERRATARASRAARPPQRMRPTRRRPSAQRWADVLSYLQVWVERAAGARWRLPAIGPRGIAMLALGAAIVASSLARGGTHGSATPPRADVSRAAVLSAAPGLKAGTPTAAASGGCALAIAPAGYVNPLAGAVVKPERIDQGVDYAGSGTLTAIGAGRVTYLATSNTGWPGAFIEYQLLAGADAGCYVFYAEGVIPVDGLRVGETLTAGQPIATIIPKYPTGIEIGWGAGHGTKAYAKVAGQWSATDDQDNVASPAGKNFSALLAALGAPPGKVEG